MMDFLYNPKGRISRKGYLMAYLIPWAIITQLLPGLFGATPLAALFMVAGLFYLWPTYGAVPIKRFHDMGVSGKYQLGFIGLIILAGYITWNGILQTIPEGTDLGGMTQTEQLALMTNLLAESSKAQLGATLLFLVTLAQILLFLLVKGDKGSNAYGDDPMATGRGFAS
ncbi:MAG: DUF805 domain-containing protein [Pseudomonadota bacterium]